MAMDTTDRKSIYPPKGMLADLHMVKRDGYEGHCFVTIEAANEVGLKFRGPAGGTDTVLFVPWTSVIELNWHEPQS